MIFLKLLQMLANVDLKSSVFVAESSALRDTYLRIVVPRNMMVGKQVRLALGVHRSGMDDKTDNTVAIKSIDLEVNAGK